MSVPNKRRDEAARARVLAHLERKRQIRNAYIAGIPLAEIARQFGIGKPGVLHHLGDLPRRRGANPYAPGMQRIDAPPPFPSEEAYRQSLIVAIHHREAGLDLSDKSTSYLEAMVQVLADRASKDGKPCA